MVAAEILPRPKLTIEELFKRGLPGVPRLAAGLQVETEQVKRLLEVSGIPYIAANVEAGVCPELWVGTILYQGVEEINSFVDEVLDP